MLAPRHMNKTQFTKNVGHCFRLKPQAYLRDGSQVNDDWILEEIADHYVRFRNSRISAPLILGYDHIQKFLTDPERGTDFGILTLDVNVVEQPDGRFTYDAVVRGGSGDRPVIPAAPT